MELNMFAPTGANYNYDFTQSGLQAFFSLFQNDKTISKTKEYYQTLTSANKIYIETKSEKIDSVLFGDKIIKILDCLNLNKTDICKICNVSRPTLYSWINNQTMPKDSNFEKINMIYEITKQLKESATTKIFSGYVEPVVSYLCSNNPNKNKLSDLIKTAINQSRERIKRINSLRKSEKTGTCSAEEQDLIQETNIMLS